MILKSGDKVLVQRDIDPPYEAVVQTATRHWIKLENGNIGHLGSTLFQTLSLALYHQEMSLFQKLMETDSQSEKEALSKKIYEVIDKRLDAVKPSCENMERP